MTDEADERRVIGVAPEAFAELDHFFDDESASLRRFERELRAISVRYGWHWLGEKCVFHRRALALYRNERYKRFCGSRRQQLQDGYGLYWILHNYDCERHVALNGLTLAPDHPFWGTFFPPLSWNCSCGISAASSERAVVRLGGDLNLRLPDDWMTVVAAVCDPIWIQSEPPDLLTILQAVVNDEVPEDT